MSLWLIPNWCVEKGYARFAGPIDDSEGWLRRARGWIRVMQTDVVLTLVVLTFATIPFYMLGAGVLNRMGKMPDGLETISILSRSGRRLFSPPWQPC